MLTSSLGHLPVHNQLISALTHEDYMQLLPRLKRVEFLPGTVLYEAGDIVTHSYFPLSGTFSLLALTEAGSTIEVTMIGNEGIVGLPAVLGIYKTPYRIVVLTKADAMKIKTDALRTEFNRCGGLHDVLLRYTYTRLAQVSQAVVCNRFHTVEQRLSCWLLAMNDRTHLNEFHITQEVISLMMGIPRTHVTMRAGALQQKGLISYTRGTITIIDLLGLEATSCECFRTVKDSDSGVVYFSSTRNSR